MSTPVNASRERPLRGLAMPGNASKYCKLAHKLGVAHQWTREEAAAAGRKAAQIRAARATQATA
jgi:hypothetical protein